MIKQGKPIYKDDRRIPMMAYMGPRRAGKRFFNNSYGNPRDPETGYQEFWTDAVFSDYKDAGFSYILPEGDAFYGENISESGLRKEPVFAKSDLYRFMQKARKHQLAVYPSSRAILDEIKLDKGLMSKEERAHVKDFIETVKREFPDVFTGILITDEPKIQVDYRVEECIRYMRELAPELDIFASQFPSYGSIDCFDREYTKEKYGDMPITYEMKEVYYREYVKCYGRMFGEFSFDHYPIMGESSSRLCPVFIRNLETVAEIAKEENFPISITLQAFRMDKEYDSEKGRGIEMFALPSYEDIRYQVYISLAFGVKRIGYFTFWQHYNEGFREVFPTSMLVYDEAEECGYRKTSIYDAVKKVNDQILKFDHVFLHYDWKGARLIRKSDDENLQFAICDYEDEYLTDINAKRDALIGYMENPEDERNGYWIVNAYNPYFFEWNEMSMRFAGATNLLYYRAGREYDIKLPEDGIFSIRLGAGEGIFVIPYVK